MIKTNAEIVMNELKERKTGTLDEIMPLLCDIALDYSRNIKHIQQAYHVLERAGRIKKDYLKKTWTYLEV